MANIAVGCNTAKDFTREEKDLIEAAGGGIMQLRTIENEDDSVFLHRQADDLPAGEIGSETFRLLCKGMLATVCNPENPGVGIAAPQIGISRRVIAVQRFDKEGEPLEIYVNPRIVSHSEDLQIGSEGCLSVPGRSGQVARSVETTISYLDPGTGTVKQETVSDFTAVIFQHEIDHLDGILYTERMEESDIRAISYTPQGGVCSRRIDIVTERGIITDISIEGGCNGNAQGIMALLTGMDAAEAAARLRGIDCKGKGTSCPDQIAAAIEQLLSKEEGA